MTVTESDLTPPAEPTPTPAVADAIPAPAAEPTPAPAEGDPAPADPAEPVPYEPNFNFKVHGEDREMDDWAKGLVTDKESEDKYREIMTKVHGIEHIKQDREGLRTEIEGLNKTKTEHETLTRGIAEMNHYVNTGNMHAFFNKVGVPKETLLNYFQQLVQLEQMTPDQRMSWEQQQNAQVQTYSLEQQNQQLQEQATQNAYDAKVNEYSLISGQPALQQTILEFDSRMGQGAFQEQVFNYGRNQQDAGNAVGVLDAVNYITKLIGGVPASQPIPAMNNGAIPPQQPPQPTAVSHVAKPTMPVVPSSGKSPVKSGIKSIADLRKAREARQG